MPFDEYPLFRTKLLVIGQIRVLDFYKTPELTLIYYTCCCNINIIVGFWNAADALYFC